MRTKCRCAHPASWVFAVLLLIPSFAWAQWDNRYPKVDDYTHHIYLEQHEFPFLSSGPIDPAPAPDGRSVAFASQGWLWLLDLESGVAVQLTDSPGFSSPTALPLTAGLAGRLTASGWHSSGMTGRTRASLFANSKTATNRL
jgi:hypothetical protein